MRVHFRTSCHPIAIVYYDEIKHPEYQHFVGIGIIEDDRCQMHSSIYKYPGYIERLFDVWIGYLERTAAFSIMADFAPVSLTIRRAFYLRVEAVANIHSSGETIRPVWQSGERPRL